MNDLVLKLQSMPDVRQLVILGGKDFNPWMIRDILATREVDSIAAYISTRDKRVETIRMLKYIQETGECEVPSNTKVYSLTDLKEDAQPAGEYCLLYDALDNIETVLDLNWKPTFLIGAMLEEAVTAFDVWEHYRAVSQQIYILTWGYDRKTEALDWKGCEDSDVELSVIFPMFKVADYLPECVESIRVWDAPYVEYLFVDDGSPDNCADIIREYNRQDSRIKLLQKENGGCASARQFGLEQAKGRYVGFIDPDDYIDPTMYRKLLSRAMLGSYEIAHCGYNELYESDGSTREVPDLIGKPYSDGTTNPDEIRELTAYLRVAIWRGIYSRKMIERNKIHFYVDIRRFDDLPFKFEVYACAKSVVSVDEHLYYYRLARPGQDISANDERLYVHFPIFAYLDEFVSAKFNHHYLEKLQICKLHTHKYALMKIKPEFAKEYLHRAKKDLLHNYTHSEMKMIYFNSISRQDKAYLWAIIHESTFFLRLLNAKGTL